MTNVQKNCKACGDLITVRLADHKRGWGNFCDKECAAVHKRKKRPGDVNAEYAKYSPWACRKMLERQRDYGGHPPPKAPPIKEQLGHNPKVKPIYHNPGKWQHCKECGEDVRAPEKEHGVLCQHCEDHHEAMEANDYGWDGHKNV